jgi:hypothetical protein
LEVVFGGVSFLWNGIWRRGLEAWESERDGLGKSRII